MGIMVWGRIFGIVAATFGRFGDNPPNCGTRHCEIPAYAGMVYYYFYDYRRPVAELSAAAADCPLPNAKHARILPSAHRKQCQIRPRFPFPPEDHSCEGRNLTVSYRQQSPRIRPHTPVPPTDHSCESRNGLRGNAKESPKYPQNIPKILPRIPVPHNHMPPNGGVNCGALWALQFVAAAVYVSGAGGGRRFLLSISRPESC